MEADDDFFHGEGFGDVVVGSCCQTGDAVLDGVFGGEEEAGDVGVEGADALEEFEAVEAGHHDVEDENVGPPGAGGGEGGGAVGGGADFPAGHFEGYADEFCQHGFVVGYEDADGAAVGVGGGGEVFGDVAGWGVVHALKPSEVGGWRVGRAVGFEGFGVVCIAGS